MRTHYFWWRDIYDMYKKKKKRKGEGYEPGGHDNEGAIYRAAIVSVVKVQLWD